MVEGDGHIASGLPGAVVMASRAGRRERALVDVSVTGIALREGDSDVSDECLPAGSGDSGMTFPAGRMGVGSGQLEFGRGVVEPPGVFPFRSRVTALAGGSQLALVLVAVTARAIASEPQIGAAQVFHKDAAPGFGRDARGVVALIAGQARMSALQRVAGLPMVELIQADIPADGDEVLAVVLGMARGALVVGAAGLEQGGVQALVASQAAADFGMAGEALELASAGRGQMATAAMQRVVQSVVGFR